MSSTTVTESEWDEQQRGWMLALARWRQSRCPGCGGSLTETTDIDNDGAYVVDDLRCHKCTAIAHASTKHTQPPTGMKPNAPQAVLYLAQLRTRRR